MLENILKMKHCKKCNTYYKATKEFFAIHSKNKDGLAYDCKKCSREYNNRYRENNPKQREKENIASIERAVKNRKIVLDSYGNKCLCCGETAIEFLCIDHINGYGNQHRKEVGTGSKLYSWIIKNNFPDFLQILCHNCNMALGLYGYCPHNPEIKRKVLVGKKLET